MTSLSQTGNIPLFELFFFFLSYLLSYDRNNHLRQHRESLRDVASKYPQPVRLLALNWSLDQPPATIHRICGDRVQERGDNHQTLRADASTKSHEEAIWRFINTTQELSPSEVDTVVEMDIKESLEESLRRAVNGVVGVLGLEMPCDEKIEEALDLVNEYKPAVKKRDEERKKKTDVVRYYGLLPEIDLESLLDQTFANQEQNDKGKDVWTHLKTNHRITKRPHVTIVHRNSIHHESELWDRCTVLHEMSTGPLFKGKLTNVVWNDRVMAITVDDFDLDIMGGGGESSTTTTTGGGGQEGRAFVSKLSTDVRERLHITVGTKEAGIQPVEAKLMVEEWKKKKNKGGGGGGERDEIIKSVKLDDLVVYGRIKGLVN